MMLDTKTLSNRLAATLYADKMYGKYVERFGTRPPKEFLDEWEQSKFQELEAQRLSNRIWAWIKSQLKRR